jgi:hypothetical protein
MPRATKVHAARQLGAMVQGSVAGGRCIWDCQPPYCKMALVSLDRRAVPYVRSTTLSGGEYATEISIVLGQ